MSIFKDTFRGYVRDQIELREELVTIGNDPKFRDSKLGARLSPHTFTLGKKERSREVTIDPGAFYSYTSNRNCVIRATSLVDYVSDVGLDIGDLGQNSFQRLKGASLSQNFILEGGILNDFARNFQTTDDEGNVKTERKLRRFNEVRQSFQRPGLRAGLAYGDFAIGADATSDGYGIVPMPGIIDANIRTKSAYGSLREAKINFEVHNQRQLEIMEMLYMRPGYMVLLEWGWSPYISSGKKNPGKIQSNLRLVENETNGDIYTNNITQYRVFNAINNLKESQDGNYDGMLGFIKNFGFKAREDGGYSCFTELSSIGEVIESIKIPPVSIINTVKDIEPRGNNITNDGGEVIVSGGEVQLSPGEVVQEQAILDSFKQGLATAAGSDEANTALNLLTRTGVGVNPLALYRQIDDILALTGLNPFGSTGLFGSITSEIAAYSNEGLGVGDVNRDIFDTAIATKIYPTFNGLLGLMHVINNYTVFGFGNNESENADEVLAGVFENYGDYEEKWSVGGGYVGAKTEDDAGNEIDETKVKQTNAYLDNVLKTFNTQRKNAGVDQKESLKLTEINDYLKNLIVFQSSDFETYMLQKFGLNTRDDLKNYIIPTTRASEEEEIDGMDQAYIRWDALASLINDYLIPKTEKGTPALNVVCDRIYHIKNNNSKLDPLLYCPIASYESDNNDNNIMDFSCDANVCILPIQFDANLPEEATEGFDSLGITDTLGYIPDVGKIPVELITSMYGFGEENSTKNIIYEGNNIFNKGPNVGADNSFSVNDTDRIRRIGSIYLNVKMLLSIAQKNADNDVYTVGSFITDVFKEVNKVCPNHNFVLTDDKESNNIFIIDLPVDNSQVPLDLHEFIPQSNKNILREFDYTSNVPSAMSATIAIQGQDPRSIQDIDGVTFAAFNRSIKNRILSKDTEPSWGKMKKDIQSQQSKILSQQDDLFKSINVYQNAFFKNIKLSDNDKGVVGGDNITGTLKAFQKNSSYLSTTQKDTNTFNSVIPLEFNAVLDGISGMVIGNMFKIEKSRLPKAYHKANVGFILFNEDQKITAGGDWTTSIGGKMTILPEKKVEVKGRATFIPKGVEEVAMVETKRAVAATVDSTTVALDQGQDAVTNINKAIAGSPLYLKKIKQNFVETIDGDPLDKTYGFTSVRTKNMNWSGYDEWGIGRGRKGPLTDNEGSYDWNDNNIGMFDSWNDGGMYLGIVKVSDDPDVREDDNYDVQTGRWSVKYPDLRRRIFNEHITKYIKDVSEEEALNLGLTVYGEEITPEMHGIEGDTNTYWKPTYRKAKPSTYAIRYKGEYYNYSNYIAQYYEDKLQTTADTAVDFATFDFEALGLRVSEEGVDDGTITTIYDYNPDGTIDDTTEGIFVPTVEFNDVKYFFTDEALTKGIIAGPIEVSHCTDIETTWLSVKFDPKVDEKFKVGWVRDRTNIKSSGADESTRITGTTFTEGSGTLSKLTETKEGNIDAWMHFSTLAMTKESAIQAFIQETNPLVDDSEDGGPNAPEEN